MCYQQFRYLFAAILWNLMLLICPHGSAIAKFLIVQLAHIIDQPKLNDEQMLLVYTNNLSASLKLEFI